MNLPWQIIKDLEVHNLRTNKEEIILANQSNSDFLSGCRLALSPTITFGLKQIPIRDGIDGPGLEWEEFLDTATQLINRSLTGNAARDQVESIMMLSTNDQWNDWYRRILIKDLRCGVSEKTVNKVVPGTVPVFSCQLAHDSANHEGKVTGRKLIEVKLDGVRVITIVYPDGRVDQFSRNGKELVNFPHIKEEFKQLSAKLIEPWVFDGEVMSGSFQDLMKQVHRKDNVQATDAILHLFDLLPLSAFEKGRWDTTQIDRSKYLIEWYEDNQDRFASITVLHHELVDLNTDKGQQEFKALNERAIAGGYEGIMIKDLDAPYECKRSHAWLKLKPYIEVTLEVQGVEEGTGKNEGRLGALVCGGIDDGRYLQVNCGSGFTDADRDAYWVSRNKLLGQLVEVRADAITQNQDGTFSLRFPRFKGFRGFEVGEKL